MHEYCQRLWRKCPVPKDQFTPMELDVFEEMFSQALLFKHAPQLHTLFPNSVMRYLQYKQIPVDERIERALAVFQEPGADAPLILRWLYSTVAEDQILFLGFFSAIRSIPPSLYADIEYYYNHPGEQT